MESKIAQLVGGYESGRITRRELIRSISLLVGAAGLPSVSAAQSAPHPLKATGVNHISYVVADYARTRDFYAGLLSLRVTQDQPRAKQCLLHFADGSYILPRNPTRPDQRPPVVNHFAVGIADWDKSRVEDELKRRRLSYRDDADIPADSVHLRDPDGYDLQLVNEKVKDL
jgi:catechol 2,3-dioxygenase-like lactoylglutathione lyase family enzyme